MANNKFRRQIRRLLAGLNYTLGIGLLLVCWQWLSTIYPTAIIPSLGEVGKAIIEIYHNDELMQQVGWSVLRVLIASLLSVLIGVALGVVGGLSTFVYRALYPLFIVFENVPPIAWIVLTIMWFSIGSMPAIAVGVLTAAPIIFFYTVEGVRATPKKLLEMATDFGMNRRERLMQIYLPSIMPPIGASLSTAMSLNWRVVVMAEALSAYNGIGQKLWGSYLYGDSSISYAYIFVIAILGLMMEYLLIKPIKHLIDRRYGMAAC